MIRERAAKEPVLILEAGDAFASRIEPRVSPEGLRARAELLVDAYNRMGLHAYTPGERDLALGLDGLKSLAEQAKFPFLAANLTGPGGEPLFKGSLVQKIGDLSIGVIGLTGQKTGYPEDRLKQMGLTVADPVAAARAEAERLKGEGAQLLVLLSHLGPGEDDAVVKAVPEIRFVLGGHSGRMTRRPRMLGARAPATAAWMLSSGSRGKYLGRLELYPAGSGPDALSFVDGGERDQLITEIAGHQRSLERTRQRMEQIKTKPLRPNDDEKRRSSRIAAMERSLERTQKQIADKQTKLEGLKRPVEAQAFFRSTLLPVEPKIAGDPGIEKQVKTLKASGALKPLPRKAPGKGDLVPFRPSPKPIRGKPLKLGAPKALAPRNKAR